MKKKIITIVSILLVSTLIVVPIMALTVTGHKAGCSSTTSAEAYTYENEKFTHSVSGYTCTVTITYKYTYERCVDGVNLYNVPTKGCSGVLYIHSKDYYSEHHTINHP